MENEKFPQSKMRNIIYEFNQQNKFISGQMSHQLQLEPESEYKSCDCLKQCTLGYFGLTLLALIIFIIYVIMAIEQNQDQEQVTIMCKLLILMSVFMCLSFIIYLYKLRHFIFTPQHSNQNSQNTSICSPYLQMKYLPIHYFFLRFATAISLLIVKLRPTYKNDCINDNCDYCESNNCDQIEIPPLYSGPLLIGFSDFAIFIASIIFALEFAMLLVYITPSDKKILFNQQPNKNLCLYMPNFTVDSNLKPTIFNYLCLKRKQNYVIFLIYSILKISLCIIIMEEYQNSSSVILITSNIYFHCIMILIEFRSFYLVRESKPGFYDNFYNYMTLIYHVIEEDKMNKFFNLSGFLSIPFTAIGIVLFSAQENPNDIINIDYYIYFDCVGVQLFAAGMIFILFLLKQTFLFLFCRYLYDKQERIQRDQIPEIQQNRMLQTQQDSMLGVQQDSMLGMTQNLYLMVEQDQMVRIRQVQPLKNGKVVKKAYVQGKENKHKRTCIICLELTTNFVSMRCHKTHIFHQQCIEAWLKFHNTCPYCNAPVTYR